MTLSAGLRLVVAPNFHIEVDWQSRVQLGTAVELSSLGLVPPSTWRPPSAEELALLVSPERPATEHLNGFLPLFVLPVHLRSTFWNMLARGSERGAIPADEFSEFVAKVSSFLEFKGLPLPAGACCDLVVKQPDSALPLEASSLWGLVNLGEDAISFIYLNAPGANIPVRFQLAPGEGIQIPVDTLFTFDRAESPQPIIMLSIRLPV